MKKIIYLMSLCLLSCEMSFNKKNDSSDIQLAKDFSEDFYSLIKNNNFNEAAQCFDNKNILVSNGLENIQKINSSLGHLDTAIFIDASSNSTISSQSKNIAEFSLNFNVIYSTKQTNEELIIEMVGDSLKITGYHLKTKD